MKKTLVVFAHPYLEHSNSNVELINFYVRHQHFTLRDLYEEYPDFHLIWFGIPPLLRLWIDEVFDRDWLKEGEYNPLENKEVYILVTTGGKERSFSRHGTYKYTVEELISSLIVSLNVFKANLKNIKIVYEANKLSKKDIILHKQKFTELLNQ